jgi:hypothetical protein
MHHLVAARLVWHHDRIPPSLVASRFHGYDTAADSFGVDGEYGLSGELQVVGAAASAASPVRFFHGS